MENETLNKPQKGAKADLLLYKIVEAEKTLDFEINAAEMQLKHVNQRFHQLFSDIKIFAFILLLPIPISLIRILLSSGMASAGMTQVADLTVYAIINLIYVIYIVCYVLSFPVFFYHLMKSIFLYQEHKKDYSDQVSMELKPQRDSFSPRKGVPTPERNYFTEQQKLNSMLFKYYLYKDKLQSLKERIRMCEIVSPMEVDEAVDQIVFYEKIIPASPYSKKLLSKARTYTFSVFFILLVLYFLSWYITNS